MKRIISKINMNEKLQWHIFGLTGIMIGQTCRRLEIAGQICLEGVSS